MAQKTSYKIAAFAVIGVVTIIAVCLFLFWRSAPVCELVNKMPVWDPTVKLANKATSDNKCLANFAGYLVYNFTDKKIEERFLELELYSIERTGGDLIQVKMNADCGNIDIFFKKEKDYYEAKEIKLNLMVPNGIQNSCYVRNPNFIHFPVGYHYLCTRDIEFDCLSYNDDTLLAFFDMMVFELELEGNPDEIKNHQFSLPTFSCFQGFR